MQEKIKQQLIRSLQKIIPLLVKQVKNLQTQVDFRQMTDKSEHIYRTAKSLIGTELGTEKKELRCADALNEMWIIATGKAIGGDISTSRMFNKIRRDKRFIEVTTPQNGDIIISPSGFQKYPEKVSNGHCGIISDACILSNNSKTGRWDSHLDLGYWERYFGRNGGFPIKFFRAV